MRLIYNTFPQVRVTIMEGHLVKVILCIKKQISSNQMRIELTWKLRLGPEAKLLYSTTESMQ